MRVGFLKFGSVFLLGLFLVSWSLPLLYASIPVTVYIYPIDEPVEWRGRTFEMGGSRYWVGEIHIQYGGVPPEGNHTRAYCLQYDVILHTGRSYTYEVVDAEDTVKWRAVSYVLSWYDPPKDDDEGAAVQGAIWNLTTGYDPSGYGLGLASEAYGKDVIRRGDTMEWLTPVGYVGPGEEITLTVAVKRADDSGADGSGRAGVRVLFETSAGTLDKDEAFTDSNGEASVTLTAPSESCVVEVKAHTRGVWPKVYLRNGETQDLIGLGDGLELTLTTEVIVIARIFVVPEFPFGTIAAVSVCFLALLIKARRLRWSWHLRPGI